MHEIILEKETNFPHIKNLTMKNLGPMRGCEYGQRRVWRVRAGSINNQSACARLWGGIPARAFVHEIILEKETNFPHIKNLTMKNLGPMRGCEYGQRRVWRVRAGSINNQSACTRLWGGIPARLCS
jgi:hypothetical protein